MSEARDCFEKHRSFLKFKVENINDSFYSDTQNYISELEQLLKECIVDKDILRYNNMELEQQKAELIEALQKCLLSSDHINLCECEVVLNKYEYGKVKK